ncbi:MAG: hypothetical protein V4552_02400 [Pseudomonadota bacterium]
MKFSLIAVAFTVACATSTIANACQATVMGGCTQEQTHDTSSHMKSQIVNKVEPVKPVSATNASATKLGSKKANNDNLIQTVNKAVLK